MALITLLTDFGTGDPFVGVMKGVILRRFSAARIVDLGHGVSPQDVVEASFWLERSYRWFPSGAVHVAVVDPSVGSARAAVVGCAEGYLFVAPDNGLLGFLDPEKAVFRSIDPARLGLPEPSATFHGRDVFAPVAADLASGQLEFEEVGEEVELSAPPVALRPEVDGKTLRGTVVAIDHFGNLITNIDGELVGGPGNARVRLGKMERPLARTYSDGAPGDYVAVVNAFGTVEVARRDSNAATSLEVERGTEVVVTKNS